MEMFAFARGGKNNTRAFNFYNMKLHDNFGFENKTKTSRKYFASFPLRRDTYENA